MINNSYNQRQDLLAERIVRGKILGNGGEVLARTEVDSDGNEKRVYPYDNLFVHVVGRFSKGKTGIEQSENFNLLTSSSNIFMNFITEMSGDKNTGDNIVTTLDVKLQKTAYDALGNRKGAVVVIDPGTGKILAMVSKPDYNPNTVAKDWDKLVENSDNNSALLNRAAQGLYAPGSTFKILTALEYIREHNGDEDYNFTCNGKDSFSGVSISCYGKKKHGKEDLKASFANSCNTSFAHIGTLLDQGRFRSLCDSFLFNGPLPVNFPYKESHFVIDSESDPSELPQTAIGQGKIQMSPLHNAMIVSSVANNGVLMKPYVVDRIEDKDGGVVKKYMPSVYGELMTSKEANILADYMKAVITEGTGRKLKTDRYTAAGKTGSAEYNSAKDSHSWFVGFAPADKPQIAVSVIVEEGGTGSEYAVPIAKKIFDAYLSGK